MTQPTFQSLITLLTGGVFAPRRTILGMVRGSGVERHRAAVHRVFAAARCSVDVVGLAVFNRMTAGMPFVYLCEDDSLLSGAML